MKVGVLTGYFSPKEGGGYTFEKEIYEALLAVAHESRHEFTVFIKGSDVSNSANVKVVNHSVPARLLSNGYLKTVGMSGYSRYWDHGYWEKNKYDRVFKENRVEVMWCTNPCVSYTEVPFLATVWDLEHRLQPYFPEIGGKGEWERRDRLFQKTLPRAVSVFTGTQKTKSDIERFYGVPEERVHVLPLPTPGWVLANAQGERQLPLPVHLDKKYLFYPAQFWPHKNHITLLTAMAILRDQHRLDLTLVLVGSDKGNKTYLQEQIDAMKLGSQVRVLGFVSNDELIALYQNALALVFPSHCGPDNLPPLEAFSLGCPVIASDLLGAREQLGEAAVWFDPRDPQQLADAVKELCETPRLVTDLVARGKARAQAWTGKDYVRRVLQLLDEFEAIRRCWK
jgi:glycosyltransferase involved in cell wall biosynthesis